MLGKHQPPSDPEAAPPTFLPPCLPTTGPTRSFIDFTQDHHFRVRCLSSLDIAEGVTTNMVKGSLEEGHSQIWALSTPKVGAVQGQR